MKLSPNQVKGLLIVALAIAAFAVLRYYF